MRQRAEARDSEQRLATKSRGEARRAEARDREQRLATESRGEARRAEAQRAEARNREQRLVTASRGSRQVDNRMSLRTAVRCSAKTTQSQTLVT